MSIFEGVATALVTPFTSSGDAIDYEKLGAIIDWQIDDGIGGLVIAGTTGEAATLGEIEHKALMKFSIDKINKRVPAIMGVGSNNTMHCLELCKEAESYGADGLLIVTPYYNKTTQAGAIKHYTYIADKINTPIIIYNVPSRTGFSISVEAIVELSKHPNIIGIKEASGDVGFVARIASNVSEDFEIYSGNDELSIPILALGGKGVISVASNIIPKKMQIMVMNYLTGEVEIARKMQLELMSFLDALFIETNPIPVKTCLNLLGCNVGPLRMPLCEMMEKNKHRLIEEIERMGMSENVIYKL